MELLGGFDEIGARRRTVDPEYFLHNEGHFLYEFMAGLRDHTDTVYLLDHVERSIVWIADVASVETIYGHHIVPVSDYCLRSAP